MSTEERLERLERQNRNFKRAAAVVSVVAVSVLLMGQARKPRTIEVETIRLLDRQGRERVTIGTTDLSAFIKGAKPIPEISLLDENGRVRVNLNLDGLTLFGEPSSGISGQSGWRRSTTITDNLIELTNSDGKNQLQIQPTYLRMVHFPDGPIHDVPETILESGRLLLENPEGAMRIAFPKPGIEITDKDQKVIWQAP